MFSKPGNVSVEVVFIGNFGKFEIYEAAALRRPPRFVQAALRSGVRAALAIVHVYFSRGSCVPRGSGAPQGCCQHFRMLFQWKPSWESSARTRSAGVSGKVIQTH